MNELQTETSGTPIQFVKRFKEQIYRFSLTSIAIEFQMETINVFALK